MEDQSDFTKIERLLNRILEKAHTSDEESQKDPSRWKKHSILYGAKNSFLFEKTNHRFPNLGISSINSDGTHFIYLYSKPQDHKYPANFFIPCSSKHRENGCYISPYKALISDVSEPFSFMHKTYIVFQIIFPLAYESNDNKMLSLMGVVKESDIENYHLIKAYHKNRQGKNKTGYR